MMTSWSSVKILKPALACLVAAMVGWPLTIPSVDAAEAVERGTPILPGEDQCHVELPAHRDWAKQEKWAWTGRICLGEIADMSKFGGGDGFPCDPKEVDDWPGTRDLSSAFLETILNHEPYRGALTHMGVRINCARFNETIDLSNMVIASPLSLTRSRFRERVILDDLQSSSLIRLSGSVFDRRFAADGLNLRGNLYIDENARFEEVRLRGAKIGGDLEASGSTFRGTFTAKRIHVMGRLTMNVMKNSEGIDLRASFEKVKLLGAQIDGNLDASGSNFNDEFSAELLRVAGDLYLRDGASFKDVNLNDAVIGGLLQLRDSEFDGHLDLTSVSIGDELHLTSP